MKIENLTQAQDYAKRLESVLKRRREVAMWSCYDKDVQIDLGRWSTVVYGWEHHRPFDEIKALTLSLLERELKMILNTLACLGVEVPVVPAICHTCGSIEKCDLPECGLKT